MNARELYSQYLSRQSVAGSNKPSSYVRAIDLLGPILDRHSRKFSDCSELWSIRDAKRISELYEYVIEQQRLGETGIFKGEEPSSYWRNRFFSAALKSYHEFLILNQYENRMWEAYKRPGVTPTDLSKQLIEVENDAAEELLLNKNMDISTREGEEVLREVKTRVNQQLFRSMILAQYEARCCITGLNVPNVLRASHIIGWAEDPNNRLNPTNGLCLSATYDAAFDAHLISLDEDYRLIFSSDLTEYYRNQAFQEQFKAFEGQKIFLPKKDLPDPSFLEKHREKFQC